MERFARYMGILLGCALGACGGGGTHRAPDSGAPMLDGATDSGAPDLDAGPMIPAPIWPTTATLLDPLDMGTEQPPVFAAGTTLAETSGGAAFALVTPENAGESAYLFERPSGSGVWGLPRLVPGREARLVASGASALLIYTDCDDERCSRSVDIFGELYTDGSGWGAPEQLDVVDGGSPYAAQVDMPIRYPSVVADGVGGFLATWYHQGGPSAVLHREVVGGVFQPILGTDGAAQGTFSFVAPAPRRYVGIGWMSGVRLVAVIDGVRSQATLGGEVGEVLAYAHGDDAFFATRSGRIFEASYSGADYGLTEVSTPESGNQGSPSLLGSGPRVAVPFLVQPGGGAPESLGVYLRRDQSGTGAGTFGWDFVDVPAMGAGVETFNAGGVSLDDGFLFFYWQGSPPDGSTPATFTLRARRMGFDGNGVPVLYDPVALASLEGVSGTFRGRPAVGAVDGAALVVVYEGAAGHELVTATLDGSAAGLMVDAVTGLATSTNRVTATPTPARFGGGAGLVFGEADVTESGVQFVEPGGARVALFDIEARAASDGQAPRIYYDEHEQAAILWSRRWVAGDSAPVLAFYEGSAVSPAEVIPGYEPGHLARGAYTHGRFAYAYAGSDPSDGSPQVVVHVRDRAGSWTLTRFDVAGDEVLELWLAPLRGGFVLTFVDDSGSGADLYGTTRAGAGWSLPTLLAEDLSVLGEDEPEHRLTANGDAVVAWWVGSNDLEAAVVTDASTGFAAPSTLRTDTSHELRPIYAIAGPAGHLVLLREAEMGSGALRYRLVEYAGGSFGAPTDPFPGLVDAPSSVEAVAYPSGFAIGYAEATGATVALSVDGSWSEAVALAGTDFQPYTLALMGSGAGVRVVLARDDAGTPTYHSSLNGGEGWGAPTTFTRPTGYNVSQIGVMNDAGDMAFSLQPSVQSEPTRLAVLRASGTLDQIDLDTRLSDCTPAVQPNGAFLALSASFRDVGGSSRIFLSAGH